MPRSSRHKSHKQSKHKEAKDYYSDSDEDVKMKERNSSKEEAAGSARAKDSNHSSSGEKRKLSSSLQLKEGKDGKDLGNGDAPEEYLSSKRRKDKVEGSSGSDRWNGGGDEKIDVVGLDKGIRVESSRVDLEKGTKSKESKGSGESKSKGSKRHESSGDKEEKNMGSVVEKEEGRSGGKSESKRRSEKESGRKESKERGYDRDKKGQESRRELEVRAADGDLPKKQASEDAVEDRPGKRGRDNTELAPQDDSRNPDLEKEVEKRIRRKREGSNDREKYQDSRESDERHGSSRVDRGKDGKYKDGGSYGDKYQDSSEKDEWHRDEKYREDVERDSRHRVDKCRDDGERENRRREDKYHEVGDKDDRRRDEKYREDGERDGRRRGDKCREDGERESKRRDDKYREDGDKDSRRDDRYYEDGERDDRHKDDKYREDGERFKEDKRREEYERESRYRDGKQGDDVDREKRLKEAKYRDERSSRDRSGDKSDAKYSREESHVSELHSRKLSRDGSPNYDDRARGKDDQGRKRTSDKEDHGDARSRSTKDQRYDSEKRSSSSSRVDLVTDRGRSSSRNADRELTPSRMRHQYSPSSVTRDHHRASKQDEPKYREYAYEERVRHTVTSIREYGSAAGVNEKIASSRSNDRVIQKEDGHLGELLSERRLKLDSRTSPRQFLDKSPSSTATDRRHFSRSDVRRNIDVEESGQRSGGSRDPKDYAGKEGRGSRDFIADTQIGDELSQGEGDSLAISSPFARPNHLPSSSKSLLPPLFRMSVDSPSHFGSSEDDCRLKFNNRPRRIGDPSMGRVQGSPWKGVPNWPSPMASPMPNGFMPFQHGPPAVGFHPVMQQFPSAPIFGVRPSMDLNHPGVPYHITDADRFSGHGRSMGWRNPVDDSIPPPLHGWDTNATTFGEESHPYGRPDWEPGRTIPSGQGWETPGDMWKGPKSEASMEVPSVSDKENQFSHSAMDVTSSAGHSGQQTEQMESDIFAESVETVHSSDVLEKRASADADPIVETTDISKLSQKSDTRLCEVYLSMLDISAELTEPEVYSKCAISLDNKSISFPEESKILYIEDVKPKQMNSNSSAPLFVTIGDSVFQKAMTLYEKQKENVMIYRGKNSASLGMQNISYFKSDEAKQNSEDSKAQDLAPAGNETQSGSMVGNCDVEVKLEEASADAYSKLDETVLSNLPEKQEEAIYDASKEDARLYEQQPEVQARVRDSMMPLENAERSGDDLPVVVEEVEMWADGNVEETMPDTKCGSLVLSEVTTKACEVEMLKSIESGSVNLSRIHHSPENTH